ncbi:MAG: hypothetical protein ACJ8GO_17640 [Ramlibacter sp.]
MSLKLVPARVALIAAALLAGASAHAQAQLEDPHTTVCRSVRGMLVPECNGAICSQGRLTGDLQGKYSTRNTSQYPAGSGWLYTSFTRIELADRSAKLLTLNEGTVPRDAQGGPDQSRAMEVLQIDEATGAFAEHTGTLMLAGAHLVGKPTAYAGRLCHRMDPRGPGAAGQQH